MNKSKERFGFPMSDDSWNNLKDINFSDDKDKELELLWESLEDIPFDFEKDRLGIIDIDWYIFTKGIDRDTIWYFFDLHHSKGIAFLMNELEITFKETPKKFKFIPNPPIIQGELNKILSQIEDWSFELDMNKERKIREMSKNLLGKADMALKIQTPSLTK